MIGNTARTKTWPNWAFLLRKRKKKNNKKTANFLKFHVVRRSKTARQGPAEAPRGSVMAGGLPCPPASFLVLFCLVLIVPYRIVSYRIVSFRRPAQSRGGVVACICLSHACRSDKLRYLTLRQRGRIEWSG